MSSDATDAAEKCPVDHETREKWLEAAKAKGQPATPHPPSNRPLIQRPPSKQDLQSLGNRNYYNRFSLDNGRWEPVANLPPQASPATQSPPKLRSLSIDREISTIPRSLHTNHDRHSMNTAEQAALPSNSERDTGHDKESGNWIYPSQEMFFNAMKRKGHDPQSSDMSTIVPIHNAVNERAWSEIKTWEAGRGSEACGGPKLISFAGDSKALTPRARWKSFVGYQKPFDRHDWVVDRCGKRVDYVIDFYSGKDEGLAGKSLNFYLDVRPKLNSWEGVKMRAMRAVGA